MYVMYSLSLTIRLSRLQYSPRVITRHRLGILSGLHHHWRFNTLFKRSHAASLSSDPALCVASSVLILLDS